MVLNLLVYIEGAQFVAADRLAGQADARAPINEQNAVSRT
jgi:hypothetical protein